MQTHDVKLDPYYARAAATGLKRFEIRNDDRNYQEGDNLVMHTILDGVEVEIESRILFKLVPADPFAIGLKTGYCGLGLGNPNVRIPNVEFNADTSE